MKCKCIYFYETIVSAVWAAGEISEKLLQQSGKKLIWSRKVFCVGGFCVRFFLLLLLSLTRINFTAAALNQASSALRETRDPSGCIRGRWDGEGQEKERSRSNKDTFISTARVWMRLCGGWKCLTAQDLQCWHAVCCLLSKQRQTLTHTLSWTHRPLLSAAQQAWVIIVIIFFIFIITATAADRLKKVAL